MLKEKGFTLIELLIVIAIVAILAGAMVPMFRVTKLQAQQARVQADLDTVKTASMMLHHDTGIWPPIGNNGDGLSQDDAPPIANWAGPYMDEWRNDPWGTPTIPRPYIIYDYDHDSVPATPDARGVRSLGADGNVGGTGANADISLLITPNNSI